MKSLFKKVLPDPILHLWYWITNNRDLLAPVIEKKFNVNLVQKEDFYSPLPNLEDLKANESRWLKPSALKGLNIDPQKLLIYWKELVAKYATEYNDLPSYSDIQKKGYGVGYTKVDARTSFYMIRDIKPKKYLEIGSGLSTYYASLASIANKKNGFHETEIICIEPYPFDNLNKIKDITIVQDFVQNVPLSVFENLNEGDVLFIDSSHAAKIDSDVYYEILDILPSLKKGVYIHIHDIPFPYNFPYPAELYMYKKKWPQFWNEPAFVQAFLSFNDTFEIIQSVPIIKFHFESEVLPTIPDYNNSIDYSNAIGSLWLKKVK